MTSQQHRLTDKDPDRMTATCAVCGPDTPMRFIPKRNHYSCRIKDREKRRESMRRNYDHERNKATLLKANFKMTLKDFDDMLSAQGGACAICRTTTSGGQGTWHVDHDSSCCASRPTCGNCIRGLLCHSCNTGIGLLKEDPVIFANALRYLGGVPD